MNLSEIRKLDPNKITANGYYCDLTNNVMFMLKDEQIQFARRYFNLPKLAVNRHITSTMPVSKSRSRKNKFRVAKHQAYNDGNFHIKGRPKKLLAPLVVLSGIVVAVSFSAFAGKTDTQKLSAQMSQQAEVTYTIEPFHEEDVLDSMDLSDEIITVKTGPLASTLPQETEETNVFEVETSIEDNEMTNREQWLKRYCDIYHVNYDVAYAKLKEVTNNFTSEDYLNGHIDGVTCKGAPVYTDNEEALILYFVRSLKQLPSRFQLTKADVKEDNGYESPTDYTHQIGRIGTLLDCDPCLLYAIVISETTENDVKWGSNLFLNSNNPAGLRDGNNWWRFDTKEEGFIELACEIQKYNRSGAYTIPEIAAIHAPISDGNETWIPNVTYYYQYALEHMEEVFGDSVKVAEETNVK